MATRVLFTNPASQAAGVGRHQEGRWRMRGSKDSGPYVGCSLDGCGWGSSSGSEGSGLAALAFLALSGRHLRAHMSHWHDAGGRRVQGRIVSRRSSSKKKGGNRIPER